MITFSLPAFLIIVVILLPNLLFVLFPPTSKPENMPEENKWISMLEHGAQFLFFVVFLFLPVTAVENRNPMLGFFMIFCAVIYYALWIRYMIKKRVYNALFETVVGIPIPMALFPILAFAFGILWLQAWLALIPLVFFAVGHFINSRNSAHHLRG